jgi:hypothetical protein
MTDAHERITLPPISSFDISPSTKHHQFQAGPSRRGAHLHGRTSWDGSSAGSNHLRHEFDISHGCGTFAFSSYSLLTLTFATPHLDPAQADMMLSRALIVAATLRPDNHAAIIRHTQSLPSWCLPMIPPPPLLGHAAAALPLIEGVPLFRKYHVLHRIAQLAYVDAHSPKGIHSFTWPRIAGSVSPRTSHRGNLRPNHKPLSHPP